MHLCDVGLLLGWMISVADQPETHLPCLRQWDDSQIGWNIKEHTQIHMHIIYIYIQYYNLCVYNKYIYIYLSLSIAISESSAIYIYLYIVICLFLLTPPLTILLHVIFAMFFPHARSYVSGGGRGANNVLSPLLLAVALKTLWRFWSHGERWGGDGANNVLCTLSSNTPIGTTLLTLSCKI